MDDKIKLTTAIRRCIGMARGYVVLDENLYELESALEKCNLHVITPEPGMADRNIAKKLLGGRILITKNSKDFVKLAPIYDFGIIALENLKYIDPSKNDTNQTANLISGILSEANLWSRRGAFLVTIKNDMTYTVRDLE
jgi:hypothetical protein